MDARPGPRWVGTALVLIQFVLFGLLASKAGLLFARSQAPAGAWVAWLAGVALGLWALAANRPGNFNITPAPRAGGHLVVKGPYRWIRHPMYTALILAAAGAVIAVPDGWMGSMLVGLVATLLVKAALEERWMVQAHPGYRDYQKTSRRFVPGVS